MKESWTHQLRSVQNALFHLNAIRIAFLDSDSISSNVQATSIQKFSRVPLGCIFCHFARYAISVPQLYVNKNQDFIPMNKLDAIKMQ